MNGYYNTRYTVSDEMLELCQLDKGTLMSRSDWTREINKYISNNKLRNIENSRKINPDEKLIKLFKLTESDIQFLTYFNIHKYVKPHLIEVDKILVKPVYEEDDEETLKTDLLTIYVIYHTDDCDINIFTTNKSKIKELIKTLAKKYSCLECEFDVKKILEETNFDQSFN